MEKRPPENEVGGMTVTGDIR